MMPDYAESAHSKPGCKTLGQCCGGTANRWRVLLLCGICFFSLGLVKQNSVLASNRFAGAEVQQRYFQGLRERQLYELLELLCQQKLSQPALSPAERRFYQIELAQTLSLHAQSVSLVEADELWAQAQQILSEFPQNDPVGIVERALLKSARSEQLYWLSLATPENVSLSQRFKSQATTAITELKNAEQSLQQAVSTEEFRLTEDRAEELRLSQARVLLRLAEISSSSLTEKNARLQAAQEILVPLVRRNVRKRWEQEGRFLELVHARLNRSGNEINNLAKSLNRSGLPEEFRQRVVAEYARYLLAEQQATAVAELILKHGQELGHLTGELEALRLQALLQMSVAVRGKGDEVLADELEQEVKLRLQRLEQRGESYQAYIVKNFQQQVLLERELGPEIAKTVVAARRAMSQQDFSSAQQQYAQALMLAEKQGRIKQILPIAQEAAAVDFQHQDFAHAIAMLEAVWRSAPALTSMEQIHLLWAQAQGRHYLAARDADKLSRYLLALQDHLARYSDRSTKSEALWLLAELQFARMQVTSALELYQQIPADSERQTSARLREGQCYQWIMQRMKDLHQPDLVWRNQAEEFSRKVLTEYDQREIATPDDAELVLLAGRFLLEGGHQNQLAGKLAERVLSASSKRIHGAEISPGAALRWKQAEQSSLALQGISLAQSGQIREAEELLLRHQQESSSPTDSLFLARQLAVLTPNTAELKVMLAELLIQLTEPLVQKVQAKDLELPPEDLVSLYTLRAEAHLQLGRITPAIELYEKLYQQQPGRRDFLSRLTSLYEECNNSACAEKCYQLWQGESQKEKQGTVLWLEARYQLARWAIRTGRTAEARKIVQVTRLLYPEAGSAELQQKYRQLELQLNP